MSASRRGSLRRALRLPLASVAFTLLLLAALEGGLRLAGVADAGAVSRLPYQRIAPPLLVPGELDDGTPVLRTIDERLPPQCVTAEKGTDALRVFVLGGSATAGLGFSPNVTFARHLERLLEATDPGRAHEVVNLGITALSSAQVRRIAAAVCAHGAPDVLVVYSGNNEFLELHATRYELADAGFTERALAGLRDTNTWRLLRRARAQPRRRDEVARRELDDPRRLSQDEIIRKVELTDGDVADVLDAYEENLRAIAATAREHGVRLVLMSVASNWRWRGREDLPADWREELGAATPAELAAELSRRSEAAAPGERHAWLYKRALVREELGDPAGARADLREAMNRDPHLRRALDAQNERVRAVAVECGAEFLDTVELLAADAPDGIVGFESFYDYVHFTPRGAVLVARGLLDLLGGTGADARADAYVRERLALDPDTERDAVLEWTGACGRPGYAADRDLWKYERMLRELDARLAADPADVAALVHRGNARFFQQGGRSGAEQDWNAALALRPDLDVVRENLSTASRRLPR